jgi:hypothetical protein
MTSDPLVDLQSEQSTSLGQVVIVTTEATFRDAASGVVARERSQLVVFAAGSGDSNPCISIPTGRRRASSETTSCRDSSTHHSANSSPNGSATEVPFDA